MPVCSCLLSQVRTGLRKIVRYKFSMLRTSISPRLVLGLSVVKPALSGASPLNVPPYQCLTQAPEARYMPAIPGVVIGALPPQMTKEYWS